MGHSIAFASFHIVEVMSSPVFASKRIGYLAAAQSFSPTTDVLLLTTNQFKKDLTNGKLQDCSQALTCLGKLVTEELGRDLEHDVSLLLNSPRPYIRKKALLVLFRLIMVHPDTLPVVSQRFRDRLVDSNPSVVCAAVTVTCELARASPKSFLSLAPLLYQLLTNKDSNNWMLIKIVKLMGVLTPLEPRLGKKLVEPITTLMRTTRAKSLLYECCSTVTSGLLAHPEAVELCAQRLGDFMDDNDQNLKYLGLLSMRKLIQAHPHLALEHRDNILDCLDDEDTGIRMRALELVSEFISKRTLRDISRILLKKLRKASAEGFSTELVSSSEQKATSLDSQSAYMAVVDQEAPYRQALAKQLLKAGEYKRGTQAATSGYDMLLTGDDFAWYTTAILGGLAEIPLLSLEIRNRIGDQLLELTSRVEALRPISVKIALSLLCARKSPAEAHATVHEKGAMSGGATPESEVEEQSENNANSDVNVNGASKIDEPTKACTQGPAEPLLSPTLAGCNAWVVGEYSELIEDHAEAAHALVTFPRKGLDSGSQVRILTAAMKVYTNCGEGEAAHVQDMVSLYVDSLVDNQYVEVQERAWLFKALLTETATGDGNSLAPLFDGKLIPVDYRAQSKIPVGDGLDLDCPLLDTGAGTLYTHLMKTIGSEMEDGEGGDEDDSLFKEAVFTNSTLSFSGVQMRPTASTSNSSALLGSLPEASDQDNSAFYLDSPPRSKSAPKASRGHIDKVEHESEQRFKYNMPQLSTEAAAVLAEEVPSGLMLSDEEGQLLQSENKSQVDVRLEAAFEGAFEPSNSRQAGKDGKRKKKKKKSKKDRGGSQGQEGTKPQLEASLIDFEDAPAESSSKDKPASAAKPKHLADALLL